MGKDFILKLSTETKKSSFFSKENFRRIFLLEKLNNRTGYILLFIFFALIAVGIANYGLIFGLMVMVIFIAIPAVYAIVAYPQIGIMLFLTLSYFILFILRMGVKFPLGTLMDGIEVLFVVSLFIKQKKQKDWKIFKGQITGMIIIWIIYNLVEVANPAAESRLAWVYTVRSVAIVMIMYFIFLYNIRTKKFIQQIFKLWLVLAFIGAIYGLKQQFIGFTGFEEAWLHSDPNIALLLFIGGTWRKFSIFNDPVIFAYTMVVSSCLCIGLMTGPISKKKKIILAFLMTTYCFSMLYSGTRGAFVLIPAAMILYSILKFNKKILWIVIAAGIGMVVLINMPTTNNTLYRFQTAFKPSQDASYLVRKNNQKRIQPFILSHPMGGGLGATGEWGQRFSPNSYLAHFPPDSGYVRVAVEGGWIGLFLLCLLMFTILKTGINNYYKIKDPELKSYCFAMLLIIFAFHIGNFPQEALVQFPSNVFFYLVAAIIVIVKRLDDQQNLVTDAKE